MKGVRTTSPLSHTTKNPTLPRTEEQNVLLRVVHQLAEPREDLADGLELVVERRSERGGGRPVQGAIVGGEEGEEEEGLWGWVVKGGW